MNTGGGPTVCQAHTGCRVIDNRDTPFGMKVLTPMSEEMGNKPEKQYL